ncbi:HlyD family secretion protein, partial [Klebsiella pneumoniae]
METLMLLTYAALCIVVFKVFRIPLNKWTVPTAVLGGIALIGAVIFGMNYNFPYTDVGNQVFRTVPIVSQVRGRVQSVPVKPNQMLHKGDVLFTLDPTPFQAKVDDLQAQIKAASQDALSLNAALSQAQAELSRAVAQRDQSRREYARYRKGHAQGAFSDQMVDTRLQTWKADEASVSAAQAKVVQARNALDSVVKGKNTTVASLLAQLQKAQFQLENTVVRAPEDGYVSTVGLRPGTMSTALGMIPLMTFVPVEGAASREYVAAFRQNALQRLHKGEPAELMFPAIPGTVFRGEVADVLPAIGESQFQGQGKLLTTDALNTHGRALVVLKVTDPRFAEYALPQGATLEAAVYSDHLKELSLIRKILIRMK